jgi:hypothetical protein
MGAITIPDVIFYEFHNESDFPQTASMFNFNKANHECVQERIGIGCENVNADGFLKLSQAFHKDRINVIKKLYPLKIYGIQMIVTDSRQLANAIEIHHEDNVKGALTKYILQPLNYRRADSIDGNSIFIPVDDINKKLYNQSLFIDKDTHILTIINSGEKVEFRFVFTEQKYNSLNDHYNENL